jgi:phage FluMu gp28-like protein
MVFEIKDGHINQRLMITMAQTDYDNQRTVLNHLLRTIPVTHGMVDRGGPGMGIAEELFKRFGDKATPIDFTNAGKDNWAKTLKKNMERKNVTIIPDRDQESQLHSIQRTYSTSNNVVYVVTSRVVKIGKKVVPHHADKFWTLAMGVWLGEQLINLNYSTPKLTTNVERKAKGASVQMAKKNFSVPRNRQLTNTRVGRSYYRNIMSKTGSMRNE